MPILVQPDIKFEKSYLGAVREFDAEKSNYHIPDPTKFSANFAEFVQKLHDEARGVNLPPGYVAHTTLWLVEGNEFLGQVDIRHELTEHLKVQGGHIGYGIRPSQRRKGYGTLILRLGLRKAKELGMSNVLVTCDITNLGSKKVIEANGGKLESVTPNRNKPDKCLYRIDT